MAWNTTQDGFGSLGHSQRQLALLPERYTEGSIS